MAWDGILHPIQLIGRENCASGTELISALASINLIVKAVLPNKILLFGEKFQNLGKLNWFLSPN